MNQFHWTYTGNYGKAYHVSIAHGEETGHLVIYCNTNIMVIDFSVLDSKQYSFFIDDELVDLSIEKTEEGFAYHCQINTNANTPLNERRRKANQEDFRLVAGGLIVILTLILFLLKMHNFG